MYPKKVPESKMISYFIDHYNTLLKIWDEEFIDKKNLILPLVPMIPQKDCLLFIGLNPSFNIKGLKKLMMDEIYDPETYFWWESRENFDPERDVNRQKKAYREYPYFARFREISKHSNIPWDHVDLFFWRQTSQKDFKKLILADTKSKSLNNFGKSQLEISSAIIEDASPRCIVVANAFASDIYKDHFSLEFSNKEGCYKQEIAGKTIPVFLSSMLTGQRALDNYSYERLRWHLSKTLDK